MNIGAKVKFEEEKNVYFLLRAFFNEFDPRSSIVIQGTEARVKIYFENQPPVASVDAISRCRVDEFVFNGEMLQECDEEEPSEQTEAVAADEGPEKTEEVTPEGEPFEQTKPTATTEEIPEQTEQPAKPERQTRRSATKKAEHTKAVKDETVNIPELEEVAKQATSFEHFAKLVAEWLEMGPVYQEFFVNLALASAEVDKITWGELAAKMQSKKQFFSETHKNVTGQKVSKKLKGYSVTMLPLLKTMRQYKDYPFGQEQLEEKSSAEQESEQAEQSPRPKRVKMACMPEIPLFEVGLGSVDKTQRIEERVEYVLGLMGWNDLKPQEKEEVFEIANLAVRLEEMTLAMVHEISYEMMSIPPVYDWDVARMTFAKFINDFVSEYAPSGKVQLQDFLVDLQKAIMFEDEIKSFDDFIKSIRK